MASLNAGDLIACVSKKLGGTEKFGRDHRVFEIFDDTGALVARTRFSHSWRHSTALSDQMLGMIRRQLGLQRRRDLVELVGCTLTREDYFRLAL